MKLLSAIIIICSLYITGNTNYNSNKLYLDSIPQRMQASDTAILRNVLCTDINYEFEGLYPDTDTLRPAEGDIIIISHILKSEGFTVTEYGSGQWQQGPRIFLLKLVKDSCECTVIKKYYYTGPELDNIRITEHITCHKN